MKHNIRHLFTMVGFHSAVGSDLIALVATIAGGGTDEEVVVL